MLKGEVDLANSPRLGRNRYGRVTRNLVLAAVDDFARRQR